MGVLTFRSKLFALTGGKDSPSEVKQCGEHCLGLRYSGEANGVPLETTMGHFKTGGCVS